MAIQNHLLVSPDFIKRITILNDSIDSEQINPVIRLTQDRHIQGFLGTRLFNKMITLGVADSWAEPYTTLREQYLLTALSWWVVVELVPVLSTSLDNTAAVFRTGDTVSNLDKQSLDNMQEYARRNAHFYTGRMIDYLQWNQDIFPEYTANTNEEMRPEYHVHAVSGLTISGEKSLIDTRIKHLLDYKP